MIIALKEEAFEVPIGMPTPVPSSQLKSIFSAPEGNDKRVTFCQRTTLGSRTQEGGGPVLIMSSR